MIMNIPPASELREQDTATLYSYIQHLQSEIERTQTVLRERNLDRQATLTELSAALATTIGIATQAHPQEVSHQTIVEDQLDPICRFQADFRLTFVNHPFATVCGKASQTLIGENLLNVVPPAYQKCIHSQIALLNAQNPVTVHESRVQRPDGLVLWLQSTTRRLECADGTIEYQAVARDITQLKQAEEAERKQQTAALQNAEAKFQQLFDAAPVAILVSNQAGRITLVNQQAEALLGYQAAELLQQPVVMLAPEADRADHPSNRARFTAELQQHPAGMQVESLARRKDGSHVPVEIQVKYIQTTDELLIMSFILDITERKQAAATLRQQRDFLQSIIDHVPGIITVKNRQGEFQLANQYTAQRFGLTPTTLVGKTGWEVNPNQAEVKRFHQATDQVFATQQPLMVTEVLLDGRAYQVNLVPLPGPTAADDLVLVVATDITERKQAKDALRHQRDFLQSVIDHIPGIITVKDRQGEFQLVNQYTASIVNKTPSEMHGKTSDEVNPNQDEVKVMHQATDQVFATQQPLFLSEVLISGRYYQVNMIPLSEPTPADDLLLIVATDITERKQADVALQQAFQAEKVSTKLKASFITNTSHAFRTPLAIMLSTAETLLRYRHKLADAQIEQRLMRLVGQVQHMHALIEDVLDLSDIQAQQGNFTPAQCDPAALFRKLMTELQNHAGTTRQLLYTSDMGLPMANLDENLLHHILNHLISNAVKYSADGKPVVVHLASRNDALVLTVRDEGMGIPAAEIQHLFQPFYRATNVGSILGTGLGLSIIKEAVELQRGSITVESQVGVGTTFTVTFLLAAST